MPDTICWTNIDSATRSSVREQKKIKFKSRVEILLASWQNFRAPGVDGVLSLHFPTNKRNVSLFVLSILTLKPTFLDSLIWECGTNPVLLCHFILSWTIRPFFATSGHQQAATVYKMRRLSCNSNGFNSTRRKCTAKWMAIYLLSLNIQRFIGHSRLNHRTIYIHTKTGRS